MNNDDEYKIKLVGQADTEGNEAYNLKLSKDRAISVKILSVSQEIKPDKIEIVAKGESESVNTADSEVSRVKNRRVEIFIIEDMQAF